MTSEGTPQKKRPRTPKTVSKAAMEKRPEDKKLRITAREAAIAATTYYVDLTGAGGQASIEEIELKQDGKHWLVTLGFGLLPSNLFMGGGEDVQDIHRECVYCGSPFNEDQRAMISVISLDPLLRKHASNGLLIDTNLLLLYLVGLYDREYIGSFKRTQKYSAEDFDLLQRLVAPFHKLITTPHILAELSNLSLTMNSPRLFEYFSRVIEVLKEMKETYAKKDTLLRSSVLPRVGFTDVSILEAAKRYKYLVLTDDFAAAACLQAAQCDVINLNHVRQMLWSR